MEETVQPGQMVMVVVVVEGGRPDSVDAVAVEAAGGENGYLWVLRLLLLVLRVLLLDRRRRWWLRKWWPVVGGGAAIGKGSKMVVGGSQHTGSVLVRSLRSHRDWDARVCVLDSP